MNYPLHDFVGNVGVFLIVGSYFLIQIGKMSASNLPYVLANLFGAVFIMYTLYYDFNLSAFIIEVFWILISVVGIGRIYLEHRRKKTG